MERKSSKKRSVKKSAKSKAKEKTTPDEQRELEHQTEQPDNSKSEVETCEIQGKTMTQSEKDEIRAAYNILSKSGDGKMGMKEVQTLLQSQFMTFTDNQAIEVFAKLDQDGNGEIDYEEFEKYVIENNLTKPSPEEFGEGMREAFGMFDTDNNGYIDASEFKACMMMLGDKMSDEEINEMMKEADTDGDGKIDYAEFCAHISKTL